MNPSLSPNAPATTLPLRFMMAGLLALSGSVVMLVVRPTLLTTYHYNQYVIAVTHLLVLGWISSAVMGAMYQLVPVALETKLYSERLARWQFVFHLIGFSGMVWMFWTWNLKQVGHFGSVFTAGVLLFVYNIGRTLLRAPRWNVIATGVTSALVWLGLAVCAGLAIAAGKCTYESASTLSPASFVGGLVHALRSVAGFMAHFDQLGAMHAHAHLAALGVFVMLIVGISYKLVPMFTLSELQNSRRALVSVVLLNAGLLGSILTILLRNPWKFGFGLVVVAGLALYGREMQAILRARKRRTLDWGLTYFLTAVGLLAPLSLLALVLSWPTLRLNPFTGQLENAYGFLGLLGVVSFAIVGMLYKILPFLVWYRSYSPHIGRSKVPSLADLYSPRLQAIGYWSYVTGLAGTTVGIVLSHELVVRAGSALLAGSLLVLGANAALILRHLIRPRIEPLGANPLARQPAQPAAVRRVTTTSNLAMPAA
jgi:hypothetical protein